MAYLSDFIGIVGVLLVLVTYLLLQLDKLSSHSLIYSLGNFLGALFVLCSLYYTWNLASVIIEIAWLIISAFGVVKVLRERKKQ